MWKIEFHYSDIKNKFLDVEQNGKWNFTNENKRILVKEIFKNFRSTRKKNSVDYFSRELTVAYVFS